MNKNQTVLNYLQTGKTLTTKKAKKKLGIEPGWQANLRTAVAGA